VNSIDKEHILQAALSVFAEHGFRGTSVKSIAKIVNIDDSLVYYHFKTKINLWNQAMFLMSEKYHQEASQIIKLNKDLSNINLGKSLTRHMVYFVAENPALYQIIMHEMTQNTDRSDWLAENMLKPFSDRLEKVLEDYSQSGYQLKMPIANYFSLNIGIIWTFFIMDKINKKLYNVDVFQKEEIERHADMVIELIYSSITKSQS